jgi:archaeal flagellar protein FlaJ
VNAGTMALALFGGYYRERRNRFSFLSNDLIKARMHVTAERWLSLATLYSLVLSSVVVTMGLAVAAFLFNYMPVWRFIFAGDIEITDIPGIAADFSLIVFGALAGWLVLFCLFILYPRVKGWDRRGKIDGHLPYAICWMSFMAATGVIPYLIFRKLAETEEFFGEISREAKLVVKDVELLGFDFISALRNLAAATPSTHLRTFLQGAITNALSGGEMGTYFFSKAKETMEDNRKKFSEFIATLGLISEIYIIGLAAAPLLVIVMFAAMMMLGGASPMILMVIIYGFIPLGSMLFLLLTDVLTPEGIK